MGLSLIPASPAYEHRQSRLSVNLIARTAADDGRRSAVADRPTRPPEHAAVPVLAVQIGAAAKATLGSARLLQPALP